MHGRLAGWLKSVGVATLSRGPMTIRPSPEMVMGPLDLLWERGLAHEQASFRHLGGGNLLLKESDVKTTKLIDLSLKVQRWVLCGVDARFIF